MLNFIAHDTAILITSSHAKTKFALARLTSENDDSRSVYQLCLSDYKLDSEDSTLLQKASDRSFAVGSDRPSLRLSTAQDHYTITNPQLITQFTYGSECYEVFAFEEQPIRTPAENEKNDEGKLSKVFIAESKKNPNEIADTAFIEMGLSEVESCIKIIERDHHVVLVADRADFDKAREEWSKCTRANVAVLVKIWRDRIFRKYTNAMRKCREECEKQNSK